MSFKKEVNRKSDKKRNSKRVEARALSKNFFLDSL